MNKPTTEKMQRAQQEVPLNAIRAFIQVARDGSITGASQTLGITQSSVSRYVAVLEDYLGVELYVRRGRQHLLTNSGRLFVDTVEEPLDTILFTAQRMRNRDQKNARRLVVRTSLATFAYTVLIPNIKEFSREMGGVTVDVTSTLSPPASTDEFDVLLTRELTLTEPADQWDFYSEQLVCVGSPQCVDQCSLDDLQTVPMITVASRPDILPAWLRNMDIRTSQIHLGARYDHHYLALPAVTTGQNLLIAPYILVADLIRQGLLKIVEGSQTPSDKKYHAFAIDRSTHTDLAGSFCRWLSRLCKATIRTNGIVS